MEDERDLTAGVIALTMLQQNAGNDNAGSTVVASLTTTLNHEQAQQASAEVTTNAAARRAQALVEGIGSAYPANVRAKAANVLKQITYLLAPDGLRLTQKELGQDVANGSADQVIDSYSGVLSILFALEGEITTGSGDVQLGDDVRALTALSSAKDQASQQRAILYGALIASALNDTGSNSSPSNNMTGPVALDDFGGLDAFTTAQDLQFADEQSFDSVASPAPDGGGQQRRGHPGLRSPPS